MIWRAISLLLLAGSVAGFVRADPPWFLEGGALIVHQVPELVYSTDPPAGGWCAAYEAHAISSWEEQVNRVDVQGSRPVVWFVLAAWLASDKEWCGCEFGLGVYDPELYQFVEYGPCYPGQGLELPTQGWPGPNEGTAFVSGGGPWTGNYTPIYVFCGYAYSDPGPGVIALGIDPPTGFAGFCNCEVLLESWEAGSMGGLGINTDGIWAQPQANAIRACCFYEVCELWTCLECRALGGTWLPEEPTCDPNPCLPPVCAPCCIGGLCGCTTQEDCLLLGGVWFPEYGDCGPPNPCVAVCCLGEQCSVVREDQCDMAGGVWHPEWTECDPNPCRPPVPTERASWGRIKALYRAQ